MYSSISLLDHSLNNYIFAYEMMRATDWPNLINFLNYRIGTYYFQRQLYISMIFTNIERIEESIFFMNNLLSNAENDSTILQNTYLRQYLYMISQYESGTRYVPLPKLNYDKIHIHLHDNYEKSNEEWLYLETNIKAFKIPPERRYANAFRMIPRDMKNVSVIGGILLYIPF